MTKKLRFWRHFNVEKKHFSSDIQKIVYFVIRTKFQFFRVGFLAETNVEAKKRRREKMIEILSILQTLFFLYARKIPIVIFIEACDMERIC